MNRVKLLAVVLALALGTTISASAKDNDHRDAHKTFEKHEHHEAVHNQDRARWAREHREHARHEAAREHHERDAMHRYDRDHHPHPTVAKNHHEPKHEGWDRGHKTGFRGQPAPHGQIQKSSYVNHHYDRHGRKS